MQLLRQVSDYALRALVHICRAGEEHTASARIMAAAEGIPEATLRKVLQKLVRAGIVTSLRGVRGGFRLALPPDEITVRRVVEAVQGPVAVNRCFLGQDKCPNQPHCPLRQKLIHLQEQLEGVLDGATVQDLAEYAPRSRNVPLSDG